MRKRYKVSFYTQKFKDERRVDVVIDKHFERNNLTQNEALTLVNHARNNPERFNKTLVVAFRSVGKKDKIISYFEGDNYKIKKEE